jgi:hypothetical protein
MALLAACLLFPRASAAQPDSVTVAPAARYAASGLRSFMMGGGYRRLWATPIRVPIADLDRLGGGLTPLRVGGGATTQTLHLMGADGRRYVLRSVEKTVGQGLPEELRGTLYESILQDQVSAFLPSGALVMPPLLEAIGVLHTDPQLVVIPDSPRLEEFREQFAGQLALFEERPDDREEGNPGFHGSIRVAATPGLMENLHESADNRVDAREFLAARLVDLLVGDRDRSVNNWLWARFDSAGKRLYRPIPRDRDQAFIRLDGALKWYLRFYEPRLVKFSGDAPAVTGLSRNAWDMDRPFLVALEREAWDRIAAETRATLTDALIDSAVARLPREHYAVIGADLARALKARRDILESAADDLFRIVNRAAEIHATDEDDIATFVYDDDGTLGVTVANARAPGDPWFRRTFRPDVTREVRLYFLGGDDSVTVRGAGSASITVRVIGGSGRDRFVDLTIGTPAPLFYDGGDASVFVEQPRTRIRRVTFDPPVAWGATAANTPDWGSDIRPIPAFPYRGDLGFFPRAGLVFTRYGFQKEPYLTRQQVEASHAIGLSRFLLKYRLDWVIATDRAHGSLDAFWSQVELIRYHGLGNDTGADGPDEQFEVHHDQASITPSVTLTRGPVALRLAAHARRSVTDTAEATVLAIERPYGSGTFTQVGATVELQLDTRDHPIAPTRGVRAAAAATLGPPLFSVDRDAFGSVDGSVAAWVSAFDGNHTLAARAGGRKVLGEFPIHDAAFLGGPETVRGLRIDRYAGDASAYGSLELRSRIADFRFLFPNQLGIIAFGDAGRVSLDGDSPGGWHTALGGGLWIAPVERAHTVRLTIASGRDYTAWYLAAGFAF